MEKWTAEHDYFLKGHGIPQGPLASALLAEAFLHPLDSEDAVVDEGINLVDEGFELVRSSRRVAIVELLDGGLEFGQ